MHNSNSIVTFLLVVVLSMKAMTYVTGFWKITNMVAPETIRIFEFSMALLIVETTFKNISNLYL